jgi:hypothetical protein
MPDYCFVLGCDRSGTTALTRLLHSHPNLVMGMERYKQRLGIRDLPTFGPPLFEPERFMDFRPGDTNITINTPRFRGHYELAAARFRDGDVRYVGDKIVAKPPLALALKAQFPSPKIVFIYRDLLRVASSFCVRARNPDDANWPKDRTHETALARWNEAFAAIDAFDNAPGPGDVFLVRHERLFNGDKRTCDAMFRFLGLDVGADVEKQFQGATANWAEHESKPLALSDEQTASLEAQLDRDMVQRFDAEFEAQLALYSAS